MRAEDLLTGQKIAIPEGLDSAHPANSDIHLIATPGTAMKVFELISPTAQSLGFEIVRIRFGLESGHTLQIMAERPDGTMEIDGCEELSRNLSAILDVEDPIPGEYMLEVSSPGIARPLTRPKDFERWAGYDSKIELLEPIDGRRRFRGELHGFQDDEILVEIDIEGMSERQIIGLPFALIGDAKLVLTDELVRESLRRKDGD